MLQHRAPWSHHGGTWGVPGGARDSHETVSTAALREAVEEAAVGPDEVRVTGVHTDDHDGWSYTTVLAEPVAQIRPVSASAESVEIRWQPVEAVDRLVLHPGFALTWPVLRAAFPPPQLIVDAANVVGSRPDGWWHRRLSAAQELHDQLAILSESGLEPWSWPRPGRVDGLSWVYPRVTMVVEGAARHIAADATLHVVRAAGSGDDAIVDVVRERPHAVVVSADRELRRRVRSVGATVVGPGWIWAALEAVAAPTLRPPGSPGSHQPES